VDKKIKISTQLLYVYSFSFYFKGRAKGTKLSLAAAGGYWLTGAVVTARQADATLYLSHTQSHWHSCSDSTSMHLPIHSIMI